MKPYYVELENTIEELEELFITRYMELMECDREWGMEVQKMECNAPHTKKDVELILKQMCSLCGVDYTC
ncbi:hypothetical protein msf2phage_65 [Enterococcus phage MSF2]|nr:hypothetical protein msf2phage_65 [Enterococcus phage MSF2]